MHPIYLKRDKDMKKYCNLQAGLASYIREKHNRGLYIIIYYYILEIEEEMESIFSKG